MDLRLFYFRGTIYCSQNVDMDFRGRLTPLKKYFLPYYKTLMHNEWIFFIGSKNKVRSRDI